MNEGRQQDRLGKDEKALKVAALAIEGFREEVERLRAENARLEAACAQKHERAKAAERLLDEIDKAPGPGRPCGWTTRLHQQQTLRRMEAKQEESDG